MRTTILIFPSSYYSKQSFFSKTRHVIVSRNLFLIHSEQVTSLFGLRGFTLKGFVIYTQKNANKLGELIHVEITCEATRKSNSFVLNSSGKQSIASNTEYLLHQRCNKFALPLAILTSLKTIESFQNGAATPLYSIRTVSEVSS